MSFRMLPPKWEVGPETVVSKVQRGVYTGDRPELRHKTALISQREFGWNIQADDMLTGLGLGWWQFPYEDWRPL
jgi:hypothetical protein